MYTVIPLCNSGIYTYIERLGRGAQLILTKEQRTRHGQFLKKTQETLNHDHLYEPYIPLHCMNLPNGMYYVFEKD